MSDGPLPTAQALAETYTGGYYDDPWAVVEQYQAYQDFTAAHPDASRRTVAEAIDVPSGRVRSWNDGSLPDPVRIVVTAENRGWLPLTFESEHFLPLNRLVAAIFAGGSINSSWLPSWSVATDAERELVERALRDLDLRSRIERADDTSRATEVFPRTDATVLGRLLHCLGAPKGEKNRDAPISLPRYIMAAPAHARTEWVRVYIAFRGTLRADDTRPGAWVSLREDRSQQYLDALATVIRLCLDDEDATVGRSEQNVYLSRAAVRELFGGDAPTLAVEQSA